MIMLTGEAGPSICLYARHSQNTTTPGCPTGHNRLWDGYSLLHANDQGSSHVQDLGM